MRKNLFFFSIFALTLLVTTGCYINMSDGNNETMIGNRVYYGEYAEKIEFGKITSNLDVYVTVKVNKDTIVEVTISDDSKPATSIVDWDKRPTDYKKELKQFLKFFEGKKIDEIKNYKPSSPKKDDTLDFITGATSTRDVILKAVQNALSKI